MTVYSWLQQPHVHEFYHSDPLPSWEVLRADYLRRVDPNWPTRCYLSCVNKPIGYIQTYRVAAYPDHAAMIGENEGIGIDLFIGDIEYFNKGWGRIVLLKFLNDVAFPLFPEERVCWIYHGENNPRAIRASQAAGFREVRSFLENGKPQTLLSLRRDEAALAAPAL